MKKNIALVAGGYTNEATISYESAANIAAAIDASLYQIFKIIITKEEWYYENNGSRYTIDKNDFSLNIDGQKVKFEVAVIVTFGSPGEDGKFQSYLDLLNIPYTNCNALTASLTFNKSFCNKVVDSFQHIKIANSVLLIRQTPYSLGVIMEKVKLPVIVKPNQSGSSIGITKVSRIEHLPAAIEKAFAQDDQILIEEYIAGREFSIGVFRWKDTIIALPPSEIVTDNEFFDFNSKFNNASQRITPAVMDSSLLNRLQDKSKAIFLKLNGQGFARLDYILEHKTEDLYFLEINTMPSFRDFNLIPQQIKAAGYKLGDFYNQMIADCLK